MVELDTANGSSSSVPAAVGLGTHRQGWGTSESVSLAASRDHISNLANVPRPVADVQYTICAARRTSHLHAGSTFYLGRSNGYPCGLDFGGCTPPISLKFPQILRIASATQQNSMCAAVVI